MGTGLRAWVWKRLGGRVDAEGDPTVGADDPVVVFVGIPERARPVRDRIEDAGYPVTATARVADPRPFAVELGVSARPSEVTLEVRQADADEVLALLER